MPRKHMDINKLEKIMQLIKDGKNATEAGYLLELSHETVQKYASAIYEIVTYGNYHHPERVSMKVIGEYCAKNKIHFPPYYDKNAEIKIDSEPDEKPILKWMDEEDKQDEDDEDDGGCTWSHFDQVIQNLTTALNDVSYKLDFIDHTLRRMANAWDGKGDLR